MHLYEYFKTIKQLFFDPFCFESINNYKYKQKKKIFKGCMKYEKSVLVLALTLFSAEFSV